MAESGDVARIVADCERYWRETGVPRHTVSEMRLELEQHLSMAAGEGRSAEAVVGSDLAAFAEEWAAEYRTGERRVSWDDVATGRAELARTDRKIFWTYAIGAVSLVGGVLAGSLLAGGGDDMDDEIWRWVWAIFAIGMGIGEIFTAGFFLLPFAIGAAAAAVLAWLGINILTQWLVFFGVSLVAFAYLRRFIARQDAHLQPRVGANRWVDASGVVLSDIDNDLSTGMVRIESEDWRAISESGDPIPAGTKVIVREVRGSRVVVSPLPKS